MMNRLPMWAAAAALSISAGSGAALAAEPKAPEPKADAAKSETPRTERREVRIYRHDGGPPDVRVMGAGGPHHMTMMQGRDKTEQLRTLLQLRPEQEGALKAYVESAGPPRERGEMKRVDRREEPRATPERLAEMEAKMAKRQAEMRQRIAATRAFYDQLDARQKKVFDAMPMLMLARPGHGPMPMRIVHRMGPPPESPPRPAPPRS
jgi:hypothetical protein